MKRNAKMNISPEEIAQFGKAVDELLREIEQMDSVLRQNQSELGRLKHEVQAAPRELQAAA